MVRFVPLRYSIPLGFLALSAVLMTVASVLRHREVIERNENLMQQRAVGLLQFTAPQLELEFARKNPAPTALLFQRLKVVPHLETALICDAAGLVLEASRPELRGRKLAELTSAAPALLGAEPGVHTQFSDDRATLWAAISLSLAGPGESAQPGWLCTESNVAAQMAPAVSAQNRGTMIIGGAILLVSAALWLYFDRTVTRRATALLAATRDFSAGRLETRVALTGADEFFQLGQAFDHMAAELQAREEALLATEAQRSTIVEHALDCIIATDREGKIVDFNPAAERTFGHARQDVLGRALADVILPPARRESLTPVLPGGKQSVPGRSFDLTACRSDGTEFAIELSFTRLPGTPARFTAFIRDITARKQTEQLIAAQRDLFAKIASDPVLPESLAAICQFAEGRSPGMLCSILMLDRDGRHLRHGAGASLPADYCRAIDGIRIGPDVGSCGTAAFRRAQVIVSDINVDPLWNEFRELARAHGLRACWSTPILSADSALLGTFAIYYRESRVPDAAHEQIIQVATHAASLVLQRARTEALLGSSESRFEKAFQANPVAISMATVREGRLLDVNERYCAFLGFAREEAIGRTVLELNMWVDPNQRAVLHRELQGNGLVRDFEAQLRAKDGTVRDTLISVALIDHPGVAEPAFISMLIDITARKRAEDDRRSLEGQLRQSQKMEAIGQLAGGVAHDFNNMLTAIIIQADLASLSEKLPAPAAESLRQIKLAGQRAAALTSQLLSFSRRQVMQLRTIDLGEFLVGDTTMLHRLLGEDIRLQLHLHSRPLHVSADPMLLGQVLLNLAVNARDAMPSGGQLTIETDEYLRTEADNQLRPASTHNRYARLRIIDTGSGIPPDIMPRIFEPFFTTKPSGKGTGLGLATVFGIVEQHGGWITVDSNPDRGTSFYIYLPVVAAPAPSAPESAPLPRIDGTETILFAEDEPAVRLATESVLASHGYRVLSAEQGQAALELWRQHHATISLLLTDLVMPGNLGGQELARLVQAEKPDLRVVFVTGYSSELVGRSLTLGRHQHFLQKPFPPESLLVKLRAALDA